MCEKRITHGLCNRKMMKIRIETPQNSEIKLKKKKVKFTRNTEIGHEVRIHLSLRDKFDLFFHVSYAFQWTQ